MARPKGSKNKSTIARDYAAKTGLKKTIPYYPKSTILWAYRKKYDYLRAVDASLKKDIKAFAVKDYFYLVEEVEKMQQQIKKRGLDTKDGRTKARMVGQTVGVIGEPDAEGGVEQDQLPSLGTDLSASNPLA